MEPRTLEDRYERVYGELETSRFGRECDIGEGTSMWMSMRSSSEPLGFMVIHPVFSQDFQFTGEGLGSWEGQPAWQVRFAQRGNIPSRIRSWSYKKTVYPIPLQGRIWIAANSYNLLHLETSLRDPVPDLKLHLEQPS